MSVRPEVVEVTDTTELVAAAGARFVETVVAAQRERGTASVVLTGGSNGIAILEWLRDNGSEIDWRSVDIWFGDDRFVPEADDERNSGQAREALLDHVDVDPARVFVMAPSDGSSATTSRPLPPITRVACASAATAPRAPPSTSTCSGWAVRATSTRCSRTPMPSPSERRRWSPSRTPPSRRRGASP